MHRSKVISKYNKLTNLIIVMILVATIALYSLNNNILFTVVMLFGMCLIGHIAIKQNHNNVVSYLKQERRKYLKDNGMGLGEKPHFTLSDDYLQAILPSPISVDKSTFDNEFVASGKVDKELKYDIRYIQYIGLKNDGKINHKQFDLTSYIISVKYNQVICNRPLLYFNSYSNIDKYKFNLNHKLEMRKVDSNNALSKSYTHHRLINYNGFHDKEMKRVIRIIDCNPDLFKTKFCKGAIFDNDFIHFIVEDELAPTLGFRYKYSNKDIKAMISKQKKQVEVFNIYMNNLSLALDDTVKTIEKRD